MRVPLIKKLRKRNIAHHNSIPNRLGNKARVDAAMKLREKHLAQLSKKPFFGKLLAGRKKVTINVNGKSQTYTLLMGGIKDAKLLLWENESGVVKRDVVFVLDPLGRLRVFSKKKNMLGIITDWIELRGFSKEKGLGEAIACKEKPVYKTEIEEVKTLSNVLTKNQRNISFQDWPSEKIPYFMQLL